MMAVGSLLAGTPDPAGLCTGVFGLGADAGAACAALSRELETISTRVVSRVRMRMDAPVSIFASLNCTTIFAVFSAAFNGAPGVLARHDAAILFTGLHLAAHPFRLAKHTQQITTQNFANVISTVAAFKQGLCNLWQISSRVDAVRSRSANAVKVGAQPNVINASHFGNMVDVVD